MSVLCLYKSIRHKKFFRFERNFVCRHIEADESYTTLFLITRSKVKVKVTEVRNLRKWPISKSSSSTKSANVHAIKKLMVSYDRTPRQYLIISGQIAVDILHRSESPDVLTFAMLESSNDDMSGTGVCWTSCLMVGVSGWKIDWICFRLHQIQHGTTAAILEISNDNISATGRSIYSTSSLVRLGWGFYRFSRSNAVISGSINSKMAAMKSRDMILTIKAMSPRLLPNYIGPCFCHVTEVTRIRHLIPHWPFSIGTLEPSLYL